MKIRPTTARKVILLALLAMGTAGVPLLVAQHAKSDVQTPPAQVITNKAPDPSGLDALLRLERQLSGSFGGSSKSLEGLMAPPRAYAPTPPPPRRQASPDRHTLQDLEKRKNWMFAVPEDDENGATQKEDSRDGRQDAGSLSTKDLAPWQRFYLRLGGEIPGHEKVAKKVETPSGRGMQELKEEDLPGNLGRTAKELRNLLRKDDDMLSGFAGTQGSERNPFELGEPVPALSLKREPNPYLQQYRMMLQEMGTVKNPLDASGSSMTTPFNSPMGNLNTGMGSARDSLAAQVNSLNHPLSSPTLPDLNANALNTWNPMYTPAIPQVPQRTAPVTTSFDAPRRKGL